MELDINGKTIETDPEGYLVNLEDWSDEVARFLASQDKLTLEDNHWKIIHYMRDYFNEYGTAPNLRILQKALKEEFGPEWGDKKLKEFETPSSQTFTALKTQALTFNDAQL